MLTKRSTIYFLLFSFLFIIACNTESLGMAIPTSTLTPDPGVVVPPKCQQPGFQTFVAIDGSYCFAYPSGYFHDEKEGHERVILRHYHDPVVSDLCQLSEQQVELSIERSPSTGVLNQDIIPTLETNKISTTPVPWSISHKKAYLRKEISIFPTPTPDSANQNTPTPTLTSLQEPSVHYHIYTQHDGLFYIIEFSATTPLSAPNTCTKNLEALFFTVLDTFTFIK